MTSIKQQKKEYGKARDKLSKILSNNRETSRSKLIKGSRVAVKITNILKELKKHPKGKCVAAVLSGNNLEK